MAVAAVTGAGRLLAGALANWAQDALSVRGERLPPSPPIRHRWLGHLHDIRTEGFVAFHRRCVQAYGPLVLLRFGPPVLGRRFLLVADPEVALLTLTQDRQRGYAPMTGPPLVFGEQAVFCTSGDDPVHAERQRLIARHLAPDMLRRHAAGMTEIWTPAIERMVSIPRGQDAVRRFDLNTEILATVQHVSLRCWMGVEPTPSETRDTLARYFDVGSLLSALLFDSWFFLHARRRVKTLEKSYAGLLARSLDAILGGGDVGEDQLRFVAESLDALGWDRRRLASCGEERARLLGSLAFYQHLFTVMLPSTGSTGGTILFLLDELAGHPELQDQLGDELAGADPLAVPRAPAVTAMAIRECLRLHPQAAAITRLLAQSRRYGGYFVPKGTYSFVQLDTLHRNPASYADPERFDPARFAPPEAALGGRWAGFSLGQMACTGRVFAELHITVFLKQLLGRYRLRRIGSGRPGHNDYRGSVTLQPEPYEIEFVRKSRW
ncbi:MAG: cytochrome P450 [Acidisphaera sp.]|nr:cytochrome P450 [Acidisphaera sp.]